ARRRGRGALRQVQPRHARRRRRARATVRHHHGRRRDHDAQAQAIDDGTPMKFSLLKSWKARIVLVLAVIGPGFITANVDNDAGGIATYSVAGAQYGYSLLWMMIPITVALVIVQEMASRMGAVTGKGLSDLIREEFGFRVTFFLMAALFATNFFNVVSEFAGVASSFELFRVSKYITVPVA